MAARRTSKSLSKAQLTELASILVDRASFANRAGLSFDGKRDLYAALGYPRSLRYIDYLDQYNRGDIAAHIVNAYPDATWAGEIDVTDDEDPDASSPFEEAFNALAERLSLWEYLHRADRLAGIGRYAVLLIGGPGDLSTPLTRCSADSIQYLLALDEERAVIQKMQQDPTDPRFGKPEMYLIKAGSQADQLGLITSDATSAALISKPCHYSRIIHVADGCLIDDVYGEPRLRRVWNRLMDLEKILGGGAEAAWRRMDMGYQVEMDPEVEFSKEDQAKLSDEIDEYVHNLRRVVKTRGVTMNPLSGQVTAFAVNAKMIVEVIAGATGIPQRLLLGSERGELASSQDRGNWVDRITERHKSFATPLIKRLVNRLIELKALPKPANPYTVVWPEIEELDEAQKATVVSSLAAANQAQMAAENRVIMTTDEIRDRVWGIEPLDTVIKPGRPGNHEVKATPPALAPAQPGVPALSQAGGKKKPAPATDTKQSQTPNEGGVAQPKAARMISAAHKKESSAIRKAAERNAPRVAKLYKTAIAVGRARVDTKRLAEHLAARDRSGAQSELSKGAQLASDHFKAVMPGAYATTMESAGAVATRALPNSGLKKLAAPILRTAGLAFRFDIKNPRVAQWAENRSGELITEIDGPTQEAIAEMVAEAMDSGLSTADLATQLRDLIGLRSDQLQQLSDLRDSGAPQSEITKLGEALLTERAELIADTETARAVNAGQLETWKQAQESGYLPDDAQRVWIGEDDGFERPKHVALNGQVVGVDEPFIVPPGFDDSGEEIEPGDEPNCRCSQGIATPEDITAYDESESADEN